MKTIKYYITFQWYTGFIKGSRTLDFQALSVGMVYIESNLGLVEKYLYGYYSEVLIVVIGINILLRFLTKTKLGSKKHA